MAIGSRSLNTQAVVGAGLKRNSKNHNFSAIYKSAVSYVLTKWDTKGVYEKDIASASDSDTGLDQVKAGKWRALLKKSGSSGFIKGGVQYPVLISNGKAYKFNLGSVGEKADFEDLEEAIAAKMSNIIASEEINKNTIKRKKTVHDRVTVAKTTSKTTLDAKLALLNN